MGAVSGSAMRCAEGVPIVKVHGPTQPGCIPDWYVSCQRLLPRGRRRGWKVIPQVLLEEISSNRDPSCWPGRISSKASSAVSLVPCPTWIYTTTQCAYSNPWPSWTHLLDWKMSSCSRPFGFFADIHGCRSGHWPSNYLTVPSAGPPHSVHVKCDKHMAFRSPACWGELGDQLLDTSF